MENVLPLLVVIPLGAAFLIPVLGLLKPGRACDIIALAAAGVLVVLAGLTFAGDPVVVTWVGKWVGQVDPTGVTGIPMVCDGLCRLMLLIINGVALLCILFSFSYMKPYTSVYLYYSPFLLMVAGMNAVVLSGDLFNIYVFIEVAAVASYALVGFGVESEELEASFKYLVLSAIASGVILVGIGIIYNQTGTLNLAQIGHIFSERGLTKAGWLAVGFFLTGFGLKAAMVPFHAWLPDAHPSAPAPISAMLSGVLIKATGVYVLARFMFNVFGGSEPVSTVLIVMGVASMLLGVFLSMAQWDFKRLLAYSSIEHMGFVILALGVGLESAAAGNSKVAALAVFAGLFHMLNHSIFKSLLFLCSGAVVHATGSRDLRAAAGVGKKMPATSLLTRIACLSISGVPPFNGFFSKLLIVIAVVWAGHPILGGVSVLVCFVTLLVFIKVQRYLISAEPSEASAAVEGESPAPMLVAMAVLAVFCVASGVLVPFYRSAILHPAQDTLLNGFKYAASVFGG